MPKIPIYFHQSQPTASGTPRVNPHALDGEFEARRNLGEAIADGATRGIETAYRIRVAREDADRDALELKLRTGLGDFLGELNTKNDTNFDSWQSRWEKRMSEILRDSVGQDRMTGAGQRKLKELTARVKEQSEFQVRDIARRKEAVVARRTFDANLAQDIHSGDEPAAYERIDAAMAKGVISGEDAAAEKATLLPRIQTQQFYQMVNYDPRAALELVRNPDRPEFAAIDEKTRHGLSIVAESAVNKDRAALFRDLGRFVQHGAYPTDSVFNGLLRKAVETEENFTPALADRIRETAAGKIKEGGGASRGILNSLVERLANFNPFDGEARAGILRDAAMLSPSDMIKFSRLYSIADGAKPATQSPVGVIAMEQLRAAKAAKRFGEEQRQQFQRDADGKPVFAKDKSGRILLDSEDRPILEPETRNGSLVFVPDQEMARVANERHSLVAAALMEWLQATPSATPAEASRFLEDSIKTVLGGDYLTPDEDLSSAAGQLGVTAQGKQKRITVEMVSPRARRVPSVVAPEPPRVGTLGDDPDFKAFTAKEREEAMRALRPGTSPDPRGEEGDEQ